MISAPIIIGLKDNTMFTEVYCIVLSVSGYQFLSSLTVCKALTTFILYYKKDIYQWAYCNICNKNLCILSIYLWIWLSVIQIWAKVYFIFFHILQGVTSPSNTHNLSHPPSTTGSIILTPLPWYLPVVLQG